MEMVWLAFEKGVLSRPVASYAQVELYVNDPKGKSVYECSGHSMQTS